MHVTTIHLGWQTFAHIIRMTMSVADLLVDCELNRFLSVDYWSADYAYCHAVDCLALTLVDAYANALGFAYFHYFQTSAFLYRLKQMKIQH